MRRLTRPTLEEALRDYLDRMQALVDTGADVKATWRAQRQSASMKRVAQILAGMTGPRQRCMYCEDSRGTDIEHFKPQAIFKDHVFLWLNMLWICSGCNRSKGSRFPCDASGQPLLIDPTAEDPWDFLFFDPMTGEITARWDRETRLESSKGSALLAIFSTLRHQAVTEGRRRVFRNLRRAVRSFLAHEGRDSSGQDVSAESLQELFESIEDSNDYGLVNWFFLREGQDEEPFRRLRDEFPRVWSAVIERLA
ncbi:MAG: hypothetical protein JF614_24065 [Acidobacteria bacterium]|nr:hypothetical protein [Acidobacteriota bacterium]